jgi:hypothetical protein
METRSASKTVVPTTEIVSPANDLSELPAVVGEEKSFVQRLFNKETTTNTTREKAAATSYCNGTSEPKTDKATNTDESHEPDNREELSKFGRLDNGTTSPTRADNRYSPISPDGAADRGEQPTPNTSDIARRIFGIGGPGDYGLLSVLGGGLVMSSPCNSELLSRGCTNGFKNLKKIKNNNRGLRARRSLRMSCLEFVKVNDRLNVLMKLVEEYGEPVVLTLLLPHLKNHIYSNQNVSKLVCEIKDMILLDDENVTYTAFVHEDKVREIINRLSPDPNKPKPNCFRRLEYNDDSDEWGDHSYSSSLRDDEFSK